jgi:hypothetical protein
MVMQALVFSLRERMVDLRVQITSPTGDSLQDPAIFLEGESLRPPG